MLVIYAPLGVTLHLPAVTVPVPGMALDTAGYRVAADSSGVVAGCAAARQGFAVAAYGPVGADGFGDDVAARLHLAEAGTTGITRHTGTRTACRVVCEGDDGRWLAVSALAASALAAAADLASAPLGPGTALLAHTGLPAPAVAAALQRARSAAAPAILQLAEAGRSPAQDVGPCDLVVMGAATAQSVAASNDVAARTGPGLIQALAHRWQIPVAATGRDLGTVAADRRRLLRQPDLGAASATGEAVLAASLAARWADGWDLAAALPASAAAAHLAGQAGPEALPDNAAVAATLAGAAPLQAF